MKETIFSASVYFKCHDIEMKYISVEQSLPQNNNNNNKIN